VTYMDLMFQNATNFNQDLCSWYNNLQNMTTVDDMFLSSGCTSPASLDLSTKSSLCQACTCSPGK